jgi:hypothetical protein
VPGKVTQQAGVRRRFFTRIYSFRLELKQLSFDFNGLVALWCCVLVELVELRLDADA